MLDREGVDIFYPNDPFFNDICYAYEEDGYDMPLSERTQRYYQNVSFSGEACDFKGIDESLNKAKCNCKINVSIEKEAFCKSNELWKNKYPNENENPPLISIKKCGK